MDDSWFLVLVYIFLALLFALLVSLIALVVYSGLFSAINIKVTKPPIGKVVIAYKDGKGPFSNCGSYFSEAASIAPTKKHIGLYYDDPNSVAPQELRWAVGAVVAEGDEKVDEVLKAHFEKEKYKFMELPAIDACVLCLFPHTTMMSILIAVTRVYPALNAFCSEQGLEPYPWLELYYDGYIHFMGPLSEQQSFVTPRALEEEQKRPVIELSETEEETQDEQEQEPEQTDEKKNDEASESSDSSYEKVEKPVRA